jgi:hypothetical protein
VAEDVYNELTFLLGIKKTRTGLSTTGVWNKRAPENPGPEDRYIEVTLEIPESLWARPRMKGRMESRLEEDYVDWIKDLKEPS